MQSFLYIKGEGWTKVPTVRLDHASLQAVCRDTRLMQLSPWFALRCSPPLLTGFRRRARKTMQGECRGHACMAMAEPQGFL